MTHCDSSMSLSAQLISSLTPAEVEFIACSHETIEIVPHFNMDRIRLISGVYGPFQPPRKVSVPLWLAINLKVKSKCNITPPEWLSAEYIKQKVDEELGQEQFTQLPFRYLEIAKVLLDVYVDARSSNDKDRNCQKFVITGLLVMIQSKPCSPIPFSSIERQTISQRPIGFDFT